MFERTGDSRHLDYEKAFEREVRKKGRQNPEIRRNYYLEDTVEEGSFVSRDRLLSCARPGGIIVPFDQLFLGLDWGRVSDQTIATVGIDQNDVLDWFAYPKTRYEEQIELLIADLKQSRRRRNGNGVEEEFDDFSRIAAVRGDSTGLGDFPMEFLQSHSGLPVGNESLVKFTLQSKHEMYTKWEQAICREPGDPMQFSYPADHPLAPTFESRRSNLFESTKATASI